jgi:hypothetical protein
VAVASPARSETLTLGPGCKATRTGLQISEALDVDAWEQLLGRVVAFSDSSAWWIGDVLAYGEWKYGEKYRAILADLELEYDRARDYAYVAGNVPCTIRRDDLSFTHHRIVAKLAPVDQEDWLARATENGWTKRELQEAIESAATPALEAAHRTLEQIRFTIAPERLERYQTAAQEAQAASVAEWALTVLDQAAGVA